MDTKDRDIKWTTEIDWCMIQPFNQEKQVLLQNTSCFFNAYKWVYYESLQSFQTSQGYLPPPTVITYNYCKKGLV